MYITSSITRAILKVIRVGVGGSGTETRREHTRNGVKVLHVPSDNQINQVSIKCSAVFTHTHTH